MRAVLAVGVILAAGALSGCYTETHVISSTWAPLRQLAQKQQAKENGGGRLAQLAAKGQAAQRPVWTVQAAALTGPGRSKRAQAVMDQLHAAGVQNVWLSGQSGVLHVLAGQFDPSHRGEVQQVLSQVQGIEQAGKHPYAQAQVVQQQVTGKQVYRDPYNLKAYHGEYTLQIGFYNGHDHQRFAHQAAASLRDRGVPAYYYDGPLRSIVTVGMFTKAEAFTTRRDRISPGEVYVRAYSDQVLDLQKRFPYNLGNGKTINQIVRGRNAGPQPSSLVKVP